MRFFQNQKMYPLYAESKRLQNMYITSGADPEAWSKKLIVDATIQGLNNEFSITRKMGPHTLEDLISYENHLSKVIQRKAIRAQTKERKIYMFKLIGDGREEADWISQYRRRLIAEVQNNLTTAREAYDTFRLMTRRPDRDRHHYVARREERWLQEEEIRRDEQGERDYERFFGVEIAEAADGDDWLGQAPAPPRTLAQIAADPQSVHTSEVVTKVKQMIELIRKIEVPADYMWNMDNVSKTMTEIISECGLSPAAASQFSAKYCAADTIYDMEEGIFGKLTDAMWQHVKKSEDSIELKKIVKSEMQDNIGMCAQGNLSRIANILVGYLDGLVVNTESRSEHIGRVVAEVVNKFSGSESKIDMRLAVMKVLVPFHMTAAEMKPWVEAAVDSRE